MSSSYFSDFFKKNLGISFLQYLTQVRIGEAVRLIKENRQNISEIAFTVGFNNIGSFYNAFKKITDCHWLVSPFFDRMMATFYPLLTQQSINLNRLCSG